MIVQINENNSDKYRKLFKEAYEALEQLDADLLMAEGKGQFSNLAEYYGHIAHLFNHAEYKYIMLPLDEDPFKIDLNTRTITVPQSFSKCASVQTDMLAETIIFVADRFFDYMDLANTIIYVQWTAPDGFKGATRVEMRDLESEPGKIKFAWPLNDLITRIPGVVKFAVRFFNFSDNDEGKELVYSLNTLTSELIIKPALHPDGPSQVEKNTLSLFKKAIVNSNYAATGVTPPTQPEFVAPGTDIAIEDNGVISAITTETTETDYMKMDSTTMTKEKFEAGIYWIFENGKYVRATEFKPNIPYFIQIEKGVKYVGLKDDAITLCAQAVAYDTGKISYKWYRQAQDGDYSDKPYDCEAIGFGTVKDIYVNVGKNPSVAAHERLYYLNDENSYDDYTGKIPSPEGLDLYERYTSLTIPADPSNNPDNQVTGLYHVAAWNTIDATGYTKVDHMSEEKFNAGEYSIKSGNTYIKAEEFDANQIYFVKVSQKELTTLYPTESTTCLLPGPRPINYTKNLDNKAIFDESEKINLNVAIKDDSYNPQITYNWKMSSSAENKVFSNPDPVQWDNTKSIDINGYSKVIVDEEVFANGIYYIKEDNKYIRAFEFDKDATYYEDNDGWYGVDVVSKLNRKEESLQSNIIKVTHKPVPPRLKYRDDVVNLSKMINKAGQTAEFEVEIDEKYLNVNDELRSEKITYIWQYALPQGPWQTFTGKELGVTYNEAGNKIIFDSTWPVLSAMIRCLVVNELNGEKTLFNHSADFDGIDEKMGMYEPNAPYTYENNNSFPFALTNTMV